MTIVFKSGRLSKLGATGCLLFFALFWSGMTLAFALTLVIGFGFGGSPPRPVMFVAWGAILVGGALACLSQSRRLAAGQSNLVTDDFHRSIRLPRTLGRQAVLVIPADRLVAIEVEKVEKRHTKENAYHSYIPSIVFIDNVGSRRRDEQPQGKVASHWGCKRSVAWNSR